MPAGSATPQLTCYGSPSATFPASQALDGFVCIQRDAKPGQRVWLCHDDGAGGFTWEQLRPYVSATVTPALNATLGTTLALSTYSGTVASPQAAIGMTVRMEPVGADPGLVDCKAWVATPGTINYRISNFALTNTSLAQIKFALYLSSPD